MEEDLYDEFGNYIGPEIQDEDEIDDDYEIQSEQQQESEGQDEELMNQQIIPQKEASQIVLYEDKKYYPELDEVYPNAETTIQEEDTQPITQPIISTEKTKIYEEYIDFVPSTTYSSEFLQAMMHKQELIRNIALVGHLHHGKTSLMDLFIRQTHNLDWNKEKYQKFTDTRLDERDRKISIKSSPMSLVLPDSKDKSYLLNLFDTPGHPNFSDEALCALRISDGAIVVVDAIEGVMIGTERLLKYLVKENIAITVFINKVDRLILELKLPPADAYLKLKHTLEEINGIIIQACPDNNIDKEKLRISPLLGNVAFGSTEYGFVFSINSFALKYSHFHQLNSEMFRRVLWGDYYYNSETRKFMNKPTKQFAKRTFVEFILEPLYKLQSRALSHEKEELGSILSSIGIYMRKDEYKLDSAPLLRRVCERFFGNVSCLVDMVVQHTPDSLQGTKLKIERYYQGVEKDKKLTEKLQEGDENGILMASVVKMYHKSNCLQFDCFGKVFSGTIKKGMNVKVLGEKYSLDDEEDMSIKPIKNLWIYESQYRIEVNSVPAGNWFLIEGIDQAVEKIATLTSIKEKDSIEIFRPIKFNTTPVVKVAIEPVIPSELPKMLEGLRKISKSYPILKTKVEESGEHVIFGTGELYMDSALFDLREKYAEIEIKVSDPSVSFCETVIDTSSILCHGETPNKKNKITIIASPLDQGLAEDIEKNIINLNQNNKIVQDFFQQKYDWDILAAKSAWAFGPDFSGPNIFLDDTLPSEIDKQLLETVRDPIIQGFNWSTKEGPLCEEPMRNVKFKMTGAQICEENIYRGGGQIIPTCRRVCYSSFLMASPRMMEPFFLTEIQCSADCLEALQLVLQRRRGHVISEMPKPGSPLYTVRAELPIIDSFGFETDLRIHTSGQAFCLSVFDHWALLPGDPLDKSIVLKILEPSPALALAREFMIKTRRRKGLNEDVSLLKFFDDPKLLEILKQDVDYKQYI